jgi:UDP-GlcNAc3NAcA epimerase
MPAGRGIELKICTIVGARPQFIKSAAVSCALKMKMIMQEVLIHTGQHYDRMMSDVFFDDLGIDPPGYNLGIGSGHHGMQTGRMLEAIETVLCDERPDWVLVFGDTNSTLAGALAAAKLHIPVGHVEAGLRSFNRRMPEEVNRVLADHLSELLFAPTATAVQNLAREGLCGSKVRLVGDVMYDAALLYGVRAQERSRILASLDLQPKRYILATIHRAENTDEPNRLRAIVEALDAVGRECPVILPLHPRTRNALERAKLMETLGTRVQAIAPVGFLDMLMLEMHAALVVTDSGGVQKEAFFYKVPCVTVRDETEWVELLESGWNHLVPPRSGGAMASAILARIAKQGVETSPYGDGRAANKICDMLAVAS